jgi:hypothetical protein
MTSAPVMIDSVAIRSANDGPIGYDDSDLGEGCVQKRGQRDNVAA